jgi:hypothetical protein
MNPNLKTNTETNTETESKLFDEIIISANLIINITSNDDVLLFIGQTPNYLSYIVERNKDRTVLRIPISGRYLTDDYTNPSDIQLQSYKQTLDNLGLDIAFRALRFLNAG